MQTNRENQASFFLLMYRKMYRYRAVTVQKKTTVLNPD